MDINITNPVTTAKIGEVVNGANAATPNDTDLVPIVESSVTKKLTLTNLKAFLKTYFDNIYSALTAASFGTFINGLTGKTTPVDADELTISDSAASNVAKKLTWANLKATLFLSNVTSDVQTQLDNRTTLLAKNNVQVDHTGTTAETKVLSYNLTGKFAANDFLQFLIRPTQSGASNKTIRIKVNNADSLTGAVTLATYTFTTTSGMMIRNMWFANTLANIKSMANTTSFQSDLATTFATSTIANTNTFDFTGTTWIIISVELVDGANTQNIHEVEIMRKR